MEEAAFMMQGFARRMEESMKETMAAGKIPLASRAGWRDRQLAAHFSRPGRPQYLQSGLLRRSCHA